MKSIAATDFIQMLDNKNSFQWIDIRETWEFEEENFGGKNIPMAELPRAINTGKIHPKSDIYLVCMTGMRASTAQLYLKQQGFKSVVQVAGGVEAMREAFQLTTDNQ